MLGLGNSITGGSAAPSPEQILLSLFKTRVQADGGEVANNGCFIKGARRLTR